MNELTPFEIARRKWASPALTANVPSATITSASVSPDPVVTSAHLTPATVVASAPESLQSTVTFTPVVSTVAGPSGVQAPSAEPAVVLAVTERVAVALERIAAALEQQQAAGASKPSAALPGPVSIAAPPPVITAAPGTVTTAAPSRTVITEAAPGIVISAAPLGTVTDAVPTVPVDTAPLAAHGATSTLPPLGSFLPAAPAPVVAQSNYGFQDSDIEEVEPEPGTRCGICHGPTVETTLIVPCGHYPYCFGCVVNARANAKKKNVSFKCPNCACLVMRDLKLKDE